MNEWQQERDQKSAKDAYVATCKADESSGTPCCLGLVLHTCLLDYTTPRRKEM